MNNAVTIIDIGIGNLRSIEKAFQSLGIGALRTDKAEDLARAERIVLPGVGAFGAFVDEFRRRGLEEPVREAVAAGKPLLGVCVGMQLLFDASEEMGLHQGMGMLPGRVVRFDADMPTDPAPDPHVATARALKVPHMGWNTVKFCRTSPLLNGLPDEAFFYFVHSYHAVAENPTDVLGETEYGAPFPAIINRNNVFGVQFHPEKSQRNGLCILENFSRLG